MIRCPKCGHENDERATTCAQCGVNLAWALANLREQGPGGPPAAPVASGGSRNKPSYPRWLDRGYKRFLFGLLAGLLGLGAGLLAFRTALRLPHGAWKQLAPPPARLAGFVAVTPWQSDSGAEMIARTADGALVRYACDGTSCTWSRLDALPPPAEAELWFGGCPEGYDRPEGTRRPRPPGVVVDSFEARYCGVDYRNDIYLVLLEDGSVWSWTEFQSGIGQFYGWIVTAMCFGSTGLAVGLIVGVVVIGIAARRGSPRP